MINFKTKKRSSSPNPPTGNRAAKVSRLYKDSEVSFYKDKKSAVADAHARCLMDLNGDELEHITRFLDTKSALSLLRSCKVSKNDLLIKFIEFLTVLSSNSI